MMRERELNKEPFKVPAEGERAASVVSDLPSVAEKTIEPRSIDYHEHAQDLIRGVIEPISGPLAGRVNVQISTDPPVMTLEHVALSPQGRNHTFRYEIALDGKEIRPSPIPKLGETVQLGFPVGPHTEQQLRTMQDTFRCACIHDPVLYGRFNRKELKLDDYQQQAVEKSLLDLGESGRALMVLGTGGGKTQIAFEIASAELSRASNLEEAVVVFIVNNNIILSEAGDKFVGRFNDAYSKSHAHGKHRDISGNVVFTTPGSLLGEERLEQILGSKKQALLIFDEVHHVVASQPDQIIKRAEAFAKASGVELRILGMTATETRPDLKSVLAYFNNHISFEQSAAELTARGFLAPFRYHANDGWLYEGGTAPTVILPDDDLAPARRQLLNSSAAFDHIEDALNTHVRDREDKRTLIVAPSVELAGSLRGHLNQNPDYNGTVVRLTAADREANPERFRDTYEAWKRGKWPEGSRFANEPVPTIVVAVDLFKEGADAPAVRTIINWADTQSLIVFLQTLGRGLRPDPFKTNLEVIDIAGTFRKVNLLQWLGDAAQARDPNQHLGTPDAGGEQGEMEGGTSFRALCELSPEVSEAVRSFLADVPSGIARRYPGFHYSAIPTQEIERLHECLAKRCGFDEVGHFDRFLTEAGRSLVSDQSTTNTHAMRERFVKAFYQYENDLMYGTDEIYREPASILVHAHLLQMLQTHFPEVKPAHFAKVFPEFSAEALDQAKIIGGNLRILRHLHFNFTPDEMAKELHDKVAIPGKLAADSYACMVVLDLVDDHAESPATTFATAEGRRVRGMPSLEGAPSQYEQRALLAAYLKHPDIEGKLFEQDFLLPRKAFEDLLVLKDLVTPSEEKTREAQGDFIRFIAGKLSDVEKALAKGDVGTIQSAVAVANTIFKSRTIGEFIESANIGGGRYQSLAKSLEVIKGHATQHQGLPALVRSMDDVLGKVSNREVSSIVGKGGYSLITQQRPGVTSLDIKLQQRLESGEEATLIEASFPIKSDFSRPQVLLISSALNDLDLTYQKLSEGEKRDLVCALCSHLEKFSARLAEDAAADQTNIIAALPVVVVPLEIRYEGGEAKQGLERDLCTTLLNDTTLDVLVAGSRLNSSPGAYNLEPSYRHALMSRVGEITEEGLDEFKQLAAASARSSFNKELLHAYETTHFVRTRISPHLHRWQELFANADVSTASARHLEVAQMELKKIASSNFGISRQDLAEHRAYCSFMNGALHAGRVSSDLALSMAAWVAWKRFPLGSYEQRQSPLRDLNRELPTLFAQLSRASELGLSIPDSEQGELRVALSTIFDTFHAKSFREVVCLPGVPHEQQETEVATLRKRLREISDTLRKLVEGVSQASQLGANQDQLLKTRREGHPFFNTDKEPVFFLSGSKRKPALHLDPKCMALKKDMDARKKQELSVGPLTTEAIESQIGYKEAAVCCKACKTPGWQERKHYDEVKQRFIFNEDTSAVLPTAQGA